MKNGTSNRVTVCPHFILGKGTFGGVMVGKFYLQTYTSEFESY